MATNRPRGRVKNVTGAGKSVHRRGSGLGTGPVGKTGRTGGISGGASFSGGSSRPASGSGTTRSSGGGLSKIIILLLVVLLGGGGGLTSILGSSGDSYESYQPQQNANNQSWQEQIPSIDLEALLGNLGGGTVSTGWEDDTQTGTLDTSVASGAREKYTEILGNGQDEMTIMLYLCGTDLESRSKMATADLQEMLNADLSDKINLIIYTGGCSQWQNNVISSRTNQIWKLEKGGLRSLNDSVGSKSMTDPDTLSSFIRYCAKNYPANRMALIFWTTAAEASAATAMTRNSPPPAPWIWRRSTRP